MAHQEECSALGLSSDSESRGGGRRTRHSPSEVPLSSRARTVKDKKRPAIGSALGPPRYPWVRRRKGGPLRQAQWAHSLLAFLDCSKCFQRVNHALAGTRAIVSGLVVSVANTALDMYDRFRHVKVHGAVSSLRWAATNVWPVRT